LPALNLANAHRGTQNLAKAQRGPQNTPPPPESVESVHDFIKRHISLELEEDKGDQEGSASSSSLTGCPKRSLMGRLRVGCQLAVGRNGTVCKCEDDRGVMYAMKRFGEARMPEGCAFTSEVAAARGMAERGILGCVALVDADEHYAVYELAQIDLLEALQNRSGSMTEEGVCRVVKGLLKVLKEMHRKGYAHTDLKPENVLLMKDDGVRVHEDDVRLGDLEWLTQIGTCREFSGSAGYVAPELIEESMQGEVQEMTVTAASDIWALGVVAYVALSLGNPFVGSCTEVRLARARLGPRYQENRWKEVSEEAKDFVRCLLEVDPQARLTADEALQHRWLATVDR